MRGVEARSRARGTTLVEVLISLAIISMMLTAVWISFRSTAQGLERTEEIQARERMIRNAMGRISSDLSMAYLSFNRPRGEIRHFTLFEGRRGNGGSSVTFSAFAHLRVRKDAKESDQSLVQYFVADDPKGRGRHLYRRETRRLTGDLPEMLERFAPAYVLLEDVEQLELWYWDVRRNEWLEEWATIRMDGQPDRLPERVRWELTVREPDGTRTRYQGQAVLLMQEKLDHSR